MLGLKEQSSTNRVIILADLDYFYAQCEEVRNQSLRDRPIVVCVYSGRTDDSGAVSTANYVARRLGVKSGISIIQAKRMLRKHEDAVFLAVDHSYYREVSNRIMHLLKNYSDRFEQVSIDEAFLDVSTTTQGDFKQASKIALSIKEQLLRQERMTCTIGVAPDKVTAKVAADYQRPDGLTVVRPEHVRSFLAVLPVGKLYGIGQKTEKRLIKMGISTIGDLAMFPVEQLALTFGKKLGTYFYNAANSLNDEPVREKEEPEQISRISTLKENTRNLHTITLELERLSEDIHRHLIQSGLAFRSVGVLAIMENLTMHTRTQTIDTPIVDVGKIKGMAGILMQELLNEITELNLRRVGVKLSGLTKQTGQTSLTDF